MLKKNILVVEDSIINRKILIGFLSAEYSCIEAENGQQALETLTKHSKSFSAIILDLAMPVMDGFSFLKAIYGKSEYKEIPIIIATGSKIEDAELETLKLGAWDFITKPYNKDLTILRLKAAIERSQISAFNELKFFAEHDPLTKLYNRRKFVHVTQQILQENPDKNFVLIRLDIDRFHLINTFFGAKEGDRVICYIADLFKKTSLGLLFTYCRINNDIFAICAEYTTKNSVFKELESACKILKSYSRLFEIVIRFGVYFIEDTKESVYEMLDKTTLACKNNKGDYIHRFCVFDSKMSQYAEKEQRIINQLDSALSQKQFCVYYQPKYSLFTNKMEGSEALIRWQHPEKGLIPPNEFIPIIEKNGTISKIDYYVWESVCSQLEKWIEQGLNPCPVSVNVSRVNLYNPELVEDLCNLVKKYNIPPRLLQLEFTESMYVDNQATIGAIVNKFHEAGFTILMDDFGSGYSSLSVLKNMETDVLKIDMRFFENKVSSGRDNIIIESVVFMAKKLHIPVIAEGVETKEQVVFLRSIGCESVQGFYFAKPMPVENFEDLIKKE